MKKKFLSTMMAGAVMFALPLQAAAADMSAEDILKKSNEAMMDLDSYTIHTSSDQTVPGMEGGENSEVTSESKADVMLDPLKMHMTTTIAGQETESYLTEDGYYVQMPEEGWVKMSGDLGNLQKSMMAEGQMSQAMPLASDMTVSEEDDAYVLTYEGDGEKLLKMSTQMLQSSGSQQDSEQSAEMQKMIEQLMEKVEIEDFSYQVTIDKENHYMTGMMMDMKLTFEESSESITISQTSDVTLSNFNGVGSIEIPQEVLDAQTLEETAGGELPDTSSHEPVYALAGALAAAAAGAVLLYRRKETA
ncbi:LPXTG cell wall anchor domain-containing protein [Halobacillus kuroshimensis]|uniref:LPXTG cell wall anchor domain-containing protein n=1 Tax=Halobacillus kuroshimensis TaxID=302481 RepID=A0ABS3DU38_9BACI|nr:DUF6612 family protein [Halobacillus kuroshimensis]MBN8234847.1 LPXTG cell wall anchor domain-containing protein [Halobacillus kuroshimensis]